MDRVIKFRGMPLDKFEFVYGYYWRDENGLHKITTINDTHICHKVYVESVGQFTGLHDKNGKEIYQHDFVKVANNVIYEVIFVDADSDNELFSQFAIRCASRDLTIGFDSYCIDKMEVIGNRFENPSLCE